MCLTPAGAPEAPEERAEEAAASHELITVDLAFAEVANVAWKRVITSGEQEEVAFRALHGCTDFIGIACEVMSAADLLEDAFRIALSERLTVYDALYLAASRRSGAPLFTTDRALSEKTMGRWDTRLV